MKDFLVLQDCDHRIVESSVLERGRTLYGHFPLSGSLVTVRKGLFRIPPSKYTLVFEKTENKDAFFQINFRYKQRIVKEDWQYFLIYNTTKELCPKCSGSLRTCELRLLQTGNYQQLEFPHNYIQQLVFILFQAKGAHPFYDFLGSYLNEYISTKEYGKIESAVIDVVELYNQIRETYSSITGEEYVPVVVNSVDMNFTEQYLSIFISTNIQSNPITVGIRT